MNSVQTILNTSSDKTTEGTGQETSSVKDGSTGSEFSTSVPTREEEECSWEVRCFHETKEESCYNQAVEVMHKSCASRNNTPKSHTDRKIDTGSNSSQEHVRGDLEGNVTSEQNRDGCVELIALEAQVFLDALDSCVGESVAVEVAVDVN
jgi:hypothetical protein